MTISSKALYSIFILLISLTPQLSIAKEEVEITVTLSTKGNDISFDQTAIEVPYGKTINMVFVNSAKSNSEIIHNVAIVREGKEEEVLKLMRASSYDSAKFPKPELLLARTKDLPPGEKETLTFKPEKTGYYPYICIVKGHGNMMGMKGILRVK